VQVKLDEVYISLRAQREKAPGEVDRRLLDQEMAKLEEKIVRGKLPTEEIEDQQEHLMARLESHILDTKNAPGEIIELSDAAKRHDRLVMLGDPGSGKSTLLRYLALIYAQALFDGRSEAGSDLGIARFPILMRIADYAEHGMPKGKSLSQYMADYYEMHECPKPGLSDLLVTELTSGNCLVLLDGLDEIVNADDRRKVVERIEDFIRFHDNRPNRFVITSRIAGYRSAPLGDRFVQYTVQEMDDTQIRRFLERWCTAVEAAQTPELSQSTRDVVARREIDGITKAVQSLPGVHRLAANPLLLRTLALIHRTGAQLPQKRIELYKLAADTLARTWRMAQGVSETALVDDKYLTRLLGRLAYWLHENKSTGIATEQEVYRELGQEWARIKGLDWDEDNPDIENEVKKFLQAVREHTGLFVERAPKRYGFMHLTFEEYYAARHLVARSKDRANLIRKHLHMPRW
jgi:predicted NACHT family NTPase